jgi:hypothetical protein
MATELHHSNPESRAEKVEYVAGGGVELGKMKRKRNTADRPP